jgi:mono/diheme cytochrome c family protein
MLHSSDFLEHRILEEQPTLTLGTNIQRAVLVAMAIVVTVFIVVAGVYVWHRTDPYVQEVLAIQGEVQRGNAIFQLNCAGCHGTLANGKVGPSLRGVSNRRSQWSLIEQITSGKTPPMPKFQAKPTDMADLLSYLKTL